MKSTLPIALIAGLVAGAAGAGIVGLVRPAASAGDDVAVAPSTDLEEVLAELRELRKENADLTDRLGALESETRLVLDAAPREVATEEPKETLPEDLEVLVASMRDPQAELPEDFTDSVGRALKTIRQEEDRERDERRREAYEERLDERLSELSLELGLTKYQSDEMRNLFIEGNDKRTELLNKAREGDGWGAVREEMRTLRDDAEKSLSQVLTPDQLEKFEEQGGSRGLMWGGGGGGGGRRRDG